MPTTQDPDLHRSASHRHMIAHLTAPLQAGAMESPVQIDHLGRVEVTWTTREPLLLVAPIAPLNTMRLRLSVSLPNTEEPIARLEFMPYTEVGAYLPLYRPLVSPDTREAAPFSLNLALTRRAMTDEDVETVPDSSIAHYIEIRLLEGLMGRMIYLLGAEKQRLRRQAREVTAMRLLDYARDDALDRIGAGLGVPRLTDTIRFVPPASVDWPAIFGEFHFGERRFGGGSPGEVIAERRREPDEEYRRRLAIYRPFAVPNRRTVIERLNGPGAPTKPELEFDPESNSGPLSELGLEHRFRVIESDNQFALAIHLISANQPGQSQPDYRGNFLEHVRRTHLIWPLDTPAANQVHDSRYLPEDERDRIRRLRRELRESFSFVETEPALAPMLALAMRRLDRCRRSLKIDSLWPVLRTQESIGGSRFELGLGAAVQMPDPGELDEMVEKLSDPDRPTGYPAEIEGLLQSMQPRSSSEDPEGKWLLEACGFSTVHKIDDHRLYISHLPVLGTKIVGPSSVDLDSQAVLELQYLAPGDESVAGGAFVLRLGLKAATAEWAAMGGVPWDELNSFSLQQFLQGVVPAESKAAEAFEASGLPVLEMPALRHAISSLSTTTGQPGVTALRLPPSLTQGVLEGNPRELRKLVRVLREHGITSVLPLMTSSRAVALIVATTRLPAAGANLSQQSATSFHWYAVPVGQKGTGGGRITGTGTDATFSPRAEGLTAVVAVGYARRGLTDPFEFRVDLPEGATLTLLQYEFLMNMLEHIHPLSVEVNTFSIRQQHVDLDEDGAPEPLHPTIAQAYRQFRRRRQSGETWFRAESKARTD